MHIFCFWYQGLFDRKTIRFLRKTMHQNLVLLRVLKTWAVDILHRFRNVKVKIGFVFNNPFVTHPRSHFHQNLFLKYFDHIQAGVKCLATSSKATMQMLIGFAILTASCPWILSLPQLYICVSMCLMKLSWVFFLV